MTVITNNKEKCNTLHAMHHNSYQPVYF